MAHHKHPPIKRRRLGKFAPVEFAFVGTTCAVIDGLLSDLYEALSPKFSVLTVTGDHQAKVSGQLSQSAEKTMQSPWNFSPLDDRLTGSLHQLALVNGNHYPADRQIVFIDPAKAGTLERRREQLTSVAAVILCGDDEQVPGWLQKDHPDLHEPWQLSTCRDGLLELMRTSATSGLPKLKALILSGGKSARMGMDKGQLIYQNGETEVERLQRICEAQGLSTYLSVAASTGGANEIADRFMGLGPAGAMASAFLVDPDAAWLVLACDLPLVDEGLIQRLLDERKPNQLATAVRGASKPFPEPLIAIYEPPAYARLLQFLSIGYACPRKVLINSDVYEVVLENESALTNANTPEERERVLDLLNER